MRRRPERVAKGIGGDHHILRTQKSFLGTDVTCVSGLIEKARSAALRTLALLPELVDDDGRQEVGPDAVLPISLT